MAVSPTPGSSAPTTCNKVTCGISPPASFSTASVSSEVFFQDVVKYSCGEGYTVTGLVGGSGAFERRCESSVDLEYVVSGAKICEPVTCGSISSTDTPHATLFFPVAVVRTAHRCSEGMGDHASLERQRGRGGC